ncbi:hypothetical protein EDB19DRAFT_1832617 [Suillus lakei]|nr:hypothetical protein EDB19DRAFT_1832617 [Suillus lakei]
MKPLPSMGNRTRKQKHSIANLEIAWACRASNKKQQTLNIEQDENLNDMAAVNFAALGAGLCLDAIPADIDPRGHHAFCEDVPDENDEDNMVAIRRVHWRENDQTLVLLEEIIDSPVDPSYVEEEIIMDVEMDAESDDSDEADGDKNGTNGQDYNIELRLTPSIEEARHAYMDL